MSEPFEIPVTYKDKEYLFTAYIRPHGYTQRIEIEVGQSLVYVEWDEERNLRVLSDPELAVGPLPDPGLVQAIVEVLEAARD
ncbi:hypothetical protein EPD60_09390 [Flaviaesturariibacter flavus]|uniref:Uncharacterized protein n=1 Tax=Flaviaesturariibacter flavus TaxID=2502780 RepID=A0A4R1BB56_9BACT|nr:hypothetical protein [Flaviaesturariibacter flavus]TCJ14210.1 hypothetical protein EPD60_09390 [Flaviaesturariibacter flavus]